MTGTHGSWRCACCYEIAVAVLDLPQIQPGVALGSEGGNGRASARSAATCYQWWRNCCTADTSTKQLPECLSAKGMNLTLLAVCELCLILWRNLAESCAACPRMPSTLFAQRMSTRYAS